MKKNGYLLLESLVSLFVLLMLILLLYPLIPDWFSSKETAKKQVEQARILYESSFDWNPNHQLDITAPDNQYKIKSSKHLLKVVGPEKEIGVKIYESSFE